MGENMKFAQNPMLIPRPRQPAKGGFRLGVSWAHLLFGFKVVVILHLLGCLDCATSEAPVDLNLTEVLNDLLDGYDKRIRPNYGTEPVTVGVTMFIISVSSISEVQMDFTMDFYFRQSWHDNRLTFKPRPNLQAITASVEMTNKIWVPDTFFANEKSAYFHKLTTDNAFLRIGATGDVLRSMRLTVTASCPMNLQYFPMDRQTCSLEIESFGYTMNDISYDWGRGDRSIGIDYSMELPQFRILGYKGEQKVEALSTGNYSRLTCKILFGRSMGYYLIQIYVPASLIVIISWVSFWLDRNATTARVALCITTVLTITMLMSNTNAALPKISYIKAIDIFLGICFLMVFATLLEHATVGYLGKRIKMRKAGLEQLQKLHEQGRQEADNIEFGHNLKGEKSDETNDVYMAVPGAGKDLNKLYCCSPSAIDKYSRILFPVCFICFQLMYWILYLRITDKSEEGLIPFRG